jgi:hypothetical protein
MGHNRGVRVALAVCAALVLAGSAGAARPLPSVRILALSPVQVRGAHFVGGEKVRVTLTAGKSRLTKTLTASRAGGFVISFGTISAASRCSGEVSVAAHGARHDSAAYDLPLMNCPTSSGPTVSYG